MVILRTHKKGPQVCTYWEIQVGRSLGRGFQVVVLDRSRSNIDTVVYVRVFYLYTRMGTRPRRPYL